MRALHSGQGPQGVLCFLLVALLSLASMPNQQEQSHARRGGWEGDWGKTDLWVKSLLFSEADMWRIRLCMSQARAASHHLLSTLSLPCGAGAHADPDPGCLCERKEKH